MKRDKLFLFISLTRYIRLKAYEYAEYSQLRDNSRLAYAVK